MANLIEISLQVEELIDTLNNLPLDDEQEGGGRPRGSVV